MVIAYPNPLTPIFKSTRLGYNHENSQKPGQLSGLIVTSPNIFTNRTVIIPLTSTY